MKLRFHGLRSEEGAVPKRLPCAHNALLRKGQGARSAEAHVPNSKCTLWYQNAQDRHHCSLAPGRGHATRRAPARRGLKFPSAQVREQIVVSLQARTSTRDGRCPHNNMHRSRSVTFPLLPASCRHPCERTMSFVTDTAGALQRSREP